MKNIAEKFKSSTDEELLRIAYLESEEYQEEVIELARKELSHRGIDDNTEQGRKKISSFFASALPIENMDEEIIEEDQDTSETVELDPDKYREMLAQLERDQNMPQAIVAGIIAAVVAASLWAIVTHITGYQIGWMAVGVGFIVGFVIREAGKGIEPDFGILGAVLSVLGCIMGNVLNVCIILAQMTETPVLEVVGLLDFSTIKSILIETFSFIDLLFYGIATFEGYKFSFREITEEELEKITIK